MKLEIKPGLQKIILLEAVTVHNLREVSDIISKFPHYTISQVSDNVIIRSETATGIQQEKSIKDNLIKKFNEDEKKNRESQEWINTLIEKFVDQDKNTGFSKNPWYSNNVNYL